MSDDSDSWVRNGDEIITHIWKDYYLLFVLERSESNKVTQKSHMQLIEQTPDGVNTLSPLCKYDRFGGAATTFDARSVANKFIIKHSVFNDISTEELQTILLRIFDRVSKEWWSDTAKAGGENGKDGNKGKIPNYDVRLPVKLPMAGFERDENGEYILTEPAWIPSGDEDVEVYPFVIIRKLNEEAIRVISYLYPPNAVYLKKQAFPSMDTMLIRPPSIKALDFSYKQVKENMNLQKLDSELDALIEKHLFVKPENKLLLKRWIQGTYFYDVFSAFPIMNVLGESVSGKSRVGNLCAAVCYHAIPMLDPTGPTIFRTKEEERPTQIIDETERFQADPESDETKGLLNQIRLLLNASYSKYGAVVQRYDDFEGKKIRVNFHAYSPTMLINISGLEGVLESRSLRLIMVKVYPERDYPVPSPNDYRDFVDNMYSARIVFVDKVHKALRELVMPPGVVGRQEELWRPIFVMNKVFGTTEEEEQLIKFAQISAKNWRAEATNIPLTELLLTCLTSIVKVSGWYSMSDLADVMTENSTKKWTPRGAGRLLKRVGIVNRQRKYPGKTYFECSPETVQDLKKRYGLIEELTDDDTVIERKKTEQNIETWAENRKV